MFNRRDGRVASGICALGETGGENTVKDGESEAVEGESRLLCTLTIERMLDGVFTVLVSLSRGLILSLRLLDGVTTVKDFSTKLSAAWISKSSASRTEVGDLTMRATPTGTESSHSDSGVCATALILWH